MEAGRVSPTPIILFVFCLAIEHFFFAVLGYIVLGGLEVSYWRRHTRRRKVQDQAVSSIVGATGEVTDALAPSGHIRVLGELWEARSARSSPPGTQVQVVAMRGLAAGSRGHRPGGEHAPHARRAASIVHWAVAVVALTLLAFAAISGRIAGTPITAAMVFTAVGLLVGSEALGLVEVAPAGETVKLLAEATLALVLFADASRIDVRALRGELSVPLRLLGIGLPLTLVAGFVLALVVFPELLWAEALLLAVILAPTDAALGQAVVTLTRLPSRVRQGLNVESGLNDGICVPLFWIVLAIAQAESGAIGDGAAVRLVLEQIGYGILAGVLAGIAAALRRRGRRWAPARRGLLAPGRAAGRRRPRLRGRRSDRRLRASSPRSSEGSCSARSGDGAAARSGI